MQISLAKIADVDSILKLQTQIYRIEKLAPNSKVALKKQLKNNACSILVAKEKENVVATATIYYIDVAARDKPYALLEGLVVDKNKRGQGFGSEFFNKCIDIAKKKGCYKMIFTSGYNREEAHDFYQRLGFKKWGYEFRIDL